MDLISFRLPLDTKCFVLVMETKPQYKESSVRKPSICSEATSAFFCTKQSWKCYAWKQKKEVNKGTEKKSFAAEVDLKLVACPSPTGTLRSERPGNCYILRNNYSTSRWKMLWYKEKTARLFFFIKSTSILFAAPLYIMSSCLHIGNISASWHSPKRRAPKDNGTKTAIKPWFYLIS